MKRTFTVIIFLLLLFHHTVFSQSKLVISFTRFGRIVSYEIFANEVLHYKLSGEHRLHANRIVALQDSMIVFDNDSYITIGQLKCVRVKRMDIITNFFRHYFFASGFGYAAIVGGNNLIFDRRPLLDENTMIISASLLTAGLIMRQLNYKRIHVTKNKYLEIVNVNYNRLNK